MPISMLDEARRIARIAAPTALTQLSMMGLWVVDTLMLFRVSVEAQDAAALGRVWAFGTAMIGFGLLFGLDPVLSQAWGARDRRRLGTALQQGLLLCLLLTLPLGILWLLTGPILELCGQNPHLARDAHTYVLVQLPALPFLLAFLVLRQYLHSRSIVFPALVIAVGANLLNALANWILIFGHWGAPALGHVGAGIATSIVEVAMVAGLALWIVRGRLYRGAWAGWSRAAWGLSGLRPVLALGLPVALQLGFEIWAFQISTLWAGRLGEGVHELASHNIVMQLASITFMVPLGVSIGTATRVGNLIGEGRSREAQLAAWLGFGMGGAAMALAGLAFVIGRDVLPTWYTTDAAVVALASSILPIAAAFQLFDGLQVVGGGILRGMGRTRPIAVINFVAYYILALPLGWWLCFHLERGLAGIWWGLALALIAVASALLVYVWRRGPATVPARVRA